ncbi:MAG: NAD+ synthase [Candidatus Bathyarchaeota archaeon]|nr:MAG: NAD+ synthase [Candidatus Bathyarchaeota archaeon]
MKLSVKALDINPDGVETAITAFIKDACRKINRKGIVLGVSGGVDSAVAAALSAKAVGKANVLALYMPERETQREIDNRDVGLLAKKFGFQLKAVDLTKLLETMHRIVPNFDKEDKVSRGNLKARLRMMILYFYANSRNLSVVGSSDKSETMIGYCTKWGDNAADLCPIMDLFKTQVYLLAAHLGVPSMIIQKPPTPALWPDQIAEAEIGMDYATLDVVLYGLEHFMPSNLIAEDLGISVDKVENIRNRWLMSEHKRRMPMTPKLGYRTVGRDFRLPWIQDV